MEKQEPGISPPIKPTPPAGWYPDTIHPGNEQWWDGITWTEFRQPTPTSAPQPPYPTTNGLPPAPTKPAFLPKTRLVGFIVACLQIVWMATFGLILILIFGIFFLAPEDGSEQFLSLWILITVLSAVAAPILMLTGLQKSSRTKVVAGGLLGTVLPSTFLAASMHFDVINNSFTASAVMALVGFLAPVVEVVAIAIIEKMKE